MLLVGSDDGVQIYTYIYKTAVIRVSGMKYTPEKFATRDKLRATSEIRFYYFTQV